MSIFDDITKFQEANPTARFWVEEILFRGRPGKGWGEVSGAHFVIGREVTDPITGQVKRDTIGPLAADQVPSDVSKSSMAELIGVAAIQQQAALDKTNADLADSQKQLADSQKNLTEARAEIDRLNGLVNTAGTTIQQLRDQVTTLEATAVGKSEG